MFDNEDKPALNPLPKFRYEIISTARAKVNIDYHIEYDHKYYSVPYQYIGQYVDVKARLLTIEIWFNNERICTHQRSYKNLYTTEVQHMPDKHKAYNNINQQTFKKWASSISPDLLEFMNGMFNGVNVEQVKYRGCLGIQKLSRTNLDVLLESVRYCNKNKIYSFKAVNEVFKKIISKPKTTDETPIKNDNLRGGKYYSEEVNYEQ